jgi:cell wall-associated NlpC family hydrolase
MITEQAIIDKFLGVPYVHQGRDFIGFDCYGLIILIYKELGYKLWDIEEDYDEEWQWKGKNSFLENYHKFWKRVSVPALFDMILFNSTKGITMHGGIALSNGRFIHTCKAGTVIGKIEGFKLAVEGYYHLIERNDNS